MEISDLIRAAGLKVTQQRRVVYELMRKLEHSSIDRVIDGVRERYPDVSVATIYRILDSFSKAGLLLKFADPSGKTYFDITAKEHLHFFTPDATVVDVDDVDLAAMIRQRLSAQLPIGQSIDEISICVTTKYNNLT